MNNSLGKRLKKLRLSVKKTLEEEGKIFNVSLNTVYRWEHDLCVPRKSILMKIAVFYNVSYDWLVNGNIPENKGNILSKCDNCILNPETSAEQLILTMLKKLPVNDKYKIIGYIERMCEEEKEEQL